MVIHDKESLALVEELPVNSEDKVATLGELSMVIHDKEVLALVEELPVNFKDDEVDALEELPTDVEKEDVAALESLHRRGPRPRCRYGRWAQVAGRHKLSWQWYGMRVHHGMHCLPVYSF